MAGATELLSAAEFQEELRRAARFGPQRVFDAPLDTAVRLIEENPAFNTSRLLTRILESLTYHGGEFRRAEVSIFDSDTLSLAIALMDAFAAGTTAREQWETAVDAAQVAEAGAVR